MDITVAATARKEGPAKVMRRDDGMVPCTVYGHVKNQDFAVAYNELHNAYRTAGASAIVQIDLEGKKVPALFHEVQQDPVSDKIIHVDFLAIDMKKEITATVPVRPTGTSYAVETLGGLLAKIQESVTVRCLPADLPHELEVDVSGLEEFGQSVAVSDLTAPSGVVIEDEQEQVLFMAQEPKRVVIEEPTTDEEGEEGEGEGEEGEGGEAAEGEGEAKAEGDDGGDKDASE